MTPLTAGDRWPRALFCSEPGLRLQQPACQKSQWQLGCQDQRERSKRERPWNEARVRDREIGREASDRRDKETGGKCAGAPVLEPGSGGNVQPSDPEAVHKVWQEGEGITPKRFSPRHVSVRNRDGSPHATEQEVVSQPAGQIQ